ncbi:transcription initiation factor TFIID subunit 9B [Geosmithia morbida]|uniref:Transcription initiation factor TFIID subunit 9B n=1 Tax=Geosmithia morbida TaxID=1094350 RepID=A0A9P4YZW3_9HYPO|nr:transcription initiation factor TFIID subunit 9B [Geosmithia morbida]KAF4125125.1 transcription initiation factor TFIID subunit 9B [Geosmithia morbida]
MSSSQPSTNGAAAPSANGSQTVPNTQQSQPPAQAQTPTPQTAGPSSSSSTSGTRPRDARLVELLLVSQGVTAYEQRVPLLLLDFAYQHTSSILSDAIHLTGDPYITQAGSKSSGAAGAAAGAQSDVSVSANAVKLAIGARLAYQFRGGSAGGGISKEYMQELARERNKVALPRIVPNEWGVRLPSERFVLSGTSWGLKDTWDEEDGSSESGGGGDAMEGIEAPDPKEDEGGDPVEGGTMDDVFGEDVDEEMAEDA